MQKNNIDEIVEMEIHVCRAFFCYYYMIGNFIQFQKQK